MSQGNLISWKVKEGQEVNPGDELAEVETDKATLSWENQDSGYIARLLVPAGTNGIPVGDPVAIIVEEEDQVPAFKDYSSPSSSTTASSGSISSPPQTESPPAEPQHVDINSRIGPAARMLLEQARLSLSAVTPTGPHGIVTKGDVLLAMTQHGSAGDGMPSSTATMTTGTTTGTAAMPAAAPSAAPSSSAAPRSALYTDVPTTQMRRIIAQRLLESKSTLPHYYISTDVSLDGIAQLREALKSQGIKVSVNDCVIKAVALALAEVPAANASWNPATESITPSNSVDISIAVATEGGLITPILKNADKKPLAAISSEVRELAARARINKLKPEEFQGGSFSISNLGMFGIDSFSAIINPPQACIMAVGGARRVAKMNGKEPVAVTMMTVTLSADNRVYDGDVASMFLNAFEMNMNNPFRLLSALS